MSATCVLRGRCVCWESRSLSAVLSSLSARECGWPARLGGLGGIAHSGGRPLWLAGSMQRSGLGCQPGRVPSRYLGRGGADAGTRLGCWDLTERPTAECYSLLRPGSFQVRAWRGGCAAAPSARNPPLGPAPSPAPSAHRPQPERHRCCSRGSLNFLQSTFKPRAPD